MSTDADLPSPWRLSGRYAQLSCSDFTATVDITAPQQGLAQLAFRGATLGGHLLGVTVHDCETPSDAYVRAADLVVTYRESDARPFSLQIYWSAIPANIGADVYLAATVSIQTRQWEAYPQVAVGSSLDRAALEAAAAGRVAILRPHEPAWSYVEVAPQEDFALAADNDAPLQTSATRWKYGPHFMERGVIRRLQVRGAVVPRGDDAAAASRLAASLLADQPPLTA